MAERDPDSLGWGIHSVQHLPEPWPIQQDSCLNPAQKKHTSGCWEPDKVCLSRQNQNSGRRSEIQSGINVCSRKYSRRSSRDSVRRGSDAAAMTGLELSCWLFSETTSLLMSGTDLSLPGYFQESAMGSWQLEEQCESCGWPVPAGLRFLVHFFARETAVDLWFLCHSWPWPVYTCGWRYFRMTTSVCTNSCHITPTNVTLLGGQAMCEPAITPTCVESNHPLLFFC